jgi:hypothetical protein
MTERTSRVRTTQLMVALLAGATATLAALLATRPALGRPTFAGGTASWTGDDLAVAYLWAAASIGSLWLAATTLACVAALTRGRVRAAHRIARFAPPMARRVLQAALVSGWALVPAAASAAPSPSVPITVHVDTGGHLTTDTRRAPTTDAPVRTPEPTRTVTRPERSSAPARAAVHVVKPGDNLWQIARAEVIRTGDTDRPGDAQIARYWRRVVAANRTTLRSGDPSLIFPGEVVALPFPVR